MVLFPGRTKVDSGGGNLVSQIDFEDDPPLEAMPVEVLENSASNPKLIPADYKYKLYFANHGLILEDVRSPGTGTVYSLNRIVAVGIDMPKADDADYDPATKTWFRQEHGATLAIMANGGTVRFSHVDVREYNIITISKWL